MPVLAAIGLATTAISAGASFVQANKQKKMMQEANAEAAKAIKEARKRLDVNVYDALTISDTPYERQREMFNAQTQQMMTGFQELGVQGMRGATAALAQGQQMQGQIADKKTQALEDLEQIQAAEEGRLRDINVQLDLQEAEGAQLAARDAEQARQAAIENVSKSVTSAADQGAKMFDLYKQDKSPKSPKAPKAPKSTSAGAGFGNGMLSSAALQALSTLSNQQPIVNPTYQTPNLQETLQQQGMTQRYYGDEQY